MDTMEQRPPIVRWTQRLEQADGLDGAVNAVRPTIRTAFGVGTRGRLLRGEWLGHAIHPPLTDLVIGSWTSATVLDLFGGPNSSDAARRLVGVGLLAVGPTAWTGWAEWLGAEERAQRVGLVHAVTNAVAIGTYAASWVARRCGQQGAGVGLALLGAGVSGVGAYLGGHLVAARKVATRHPAYADGPVSPGAAPTGT
jgi:uncharacterized membrane protein